MWGVVDCVRTVGPRAGEPGISVIVGARGTPGHRGNDVEPIEGISLGRPADIHLEQFEPRYALRDVIQVATFEGSVLGHSTALHKVRTHLPHDVFDTPDAVVGL